MGKKHLVSTASTYNKKYLAVLAGVAQWIEHGPANQRVVVQYTVWAHVWVAGHFPAGGIQKATTP